MYVYVKKKKYIFLYTCICINIYIYTYIYTYIYIYMTYICIYTCMCVYIYIYIHVICKSVRCARYLLYFWQTRGAWGVANCQASLSIDRALLFLQQLFVLHRICDVCHLLPAGARVEWGRFHNSRLSVKWWFGNIVRDSLREILIFQTAHPNQHMMHMSQSSVG